MKRLTPLLAAPLFLTGCAFLADAREDEVPSAAELGFGDCRPAGPHDPAAPGEWVCDEGDGDVRYKPRHRIEDDH
jgi:hypothetical protein